MDLIQTSEAQGLNPDTERVALGLAHLPWELLHDGNGFLPVRSVQQRQTQVIGVQRCLNNTQEGTAMLCPTRNLYVSRFS